MDESCCVIDLSSSKSKNNRQDQHQSHSRPIYHQRKRLEVIHSFNLLVSSMIQQNLALSLQIIPSGNHLHLKAHVEGNISSMARASQHPMRPYHSAKYQSPFDMPSNILLNLVHSLLVPMSAYLLNWHQRSLDSSSPKYHHRDRRSAAFPPSYSSNYWNELLTKPNASSSSSSIVNSKLIAVLSLAFPPVYHHYNTPLVLFPILSSALRHCRVWTTISIFILIFTIQMIFEFWHIIIGIIRKLKLIGIYFFR